MKLILAVIRPHRLQDVKESLSEIGVAGLTVTDVRGAGRQKGQVERYRGSEYSIDLLAKCIRAKSIPGPVSLFSGCTKMLDSGRPFSCSRAKSM